MFSRSVQRLLISGPGHLASPFRSEGFRRSVWRPIISALALHAPCRRHKAVPRRQGGKACPPEYNPRACCARLLCGVQIVAPDALKVVVTAW